MKKYLLLTVLTLAFAAPAWAQTPPAGSPPPQGGPMQGQMQGQMQGMGAERFEQHKAEILTRIAAHIAELQSRQSCVQAATTHEGLRACMPEGPPHGGQMGGMGGMGAMQGMQQGGSAPPPGR